MTEKEALEDIVESGINLGGGDYVDIKALRVAAKALEDVQKYRAIGTVEELQALKEKAKVKKPIDKSQNPKNWHVMACPNCEHIFWNSGQFIHYEPKFCNYCGQKLDWSKGRRRSHEDVHL